MTSRTQQRPATGARFSILSDAPSVTADDPLEFDAMAERLERIITASRHSSPFTVSIEASWGGGKSSLMRRVQQRLEPPDATRRVRADAAVRTVWFNAWTAPETQVLEGLVRSVLDKLDSSVLRRVARQRRLLRWFGFGASVLGGLLRMSSVVDRIWAQVEADPKQRNELNDLVRQAMEEWMAKTDRPGESLIVVFIDDLDRCTSATVLQVFEAVKLYLDAPGFVFVLGWDTEQVLRAVAAEKGGDDRLPQRYVEKIVQFGFRIPRPTAPQLSVLADSLCASAGLTDDVLGADDRQLLLNATDGNPRQLKRFINRFVLLHEIVGTAAEPEIVIQLMVLQSSYESFFRLLANVPVEGDGDNPLFEFADYAKAREARSLGRFGELAEILKARRYETTADNVESAFVAFERDLPAEYPALVVDRPFTDLVQKMTDEDKRTLRRLARSEEIAFADPVLSSTASPTSTTTSGPPPSPPPHPPIPTSAPESPGSRPSSKIAPPRHRRTVLWVDDDPEGPNPAVLPAGAELLVARSTDEARRLIAGRSEPVDLLISDIGRGSDPQAGLEGLRHLREDDGYDGPAIFFTLRPTTGQVADARELAADVTASPMELERLTAAYLGSEPPTAMS